jgi:transcriptional regulator with XRE-family HTH domain
MQNNRNGRGETNILRLIRQDRGLTQVELARLARVGRRTVQRYERNGPGALTPALDRIVWALSVFEGVPS